MATANAERLAQNEAIFRSVNEHIREAATAQGPDEHLYEFLCECSDPSCGKRIELTLDAYERVRAEGTHFVLAPGHAEPEIERVLVSAPGHVVVEKTGVAGETADALDPRSEA